MLGVLSVNQLTILLIVFMNFKNMPFYLNIWLSNMYKSFSLVASE